MTRVDTDQLFAELVKAGDEALAALLTGFGLDVAPGPVRTGPSSGLRVVWRADPRS